MQHLQCREKEEEEEEEGKKQNRKPTKVKVFVHISMWQRSEKEIALVSNGMFEVMQNTHSSGKANRLRNDRGILLSKDAQTWSYARLI